MVTTLSPGDLAIIGVNTDNDDAFKFVLLTDIDAGTEIFFTDNGVQSDGSFRNTEGILKYTAPSALTAGTAIEFTEISENFSEVDNGFSLSTTGDQIIAYQETSTSLNFIYAVHTDSTKFQTDATDSNTSALPPGLVVGTSAVAVGATTALDFDNSTYNGTVTTGTKAKLLAAISDAANWNGSDTRIDPLANFSFSLVDDTAEYQGSSLNDLLNGQNGADTIFGAEGDDTIAGNAGADRLHGDGGSDVLDGGDNDDFINGGTDSDDITGGNGNDFLLGDEGTDTLSGSAGEDTLMGGAGNDILNGGADSDRLSGFGGADVFVLTKGDVNNIIYDYTDGTDKFGLELSSFTGGTVGEAFNSELSFAANGTSTDIVSDSKVLATVYNTVPGDFAVDDFVEF